MNFRTAQSAQLDGVSDLAACGKSRFLTVAVP
jgi:hypothetical protein